MFRKKKSQDCAKAKEAELANMDADVESAIRLLLAKGMHPDLIDEARIALLHAEGPLDIAQRLADLFAAAGITSVGIGSHAHRTYAASESLTARNELKDICANVNETLAHKEECAWKKNEQEADDDSDEKKKAEKGFGASA